MEYVQLFGLTISLLIAVALATYGWLYRSRNGAPAIVILSVLFFLWHLTTFFEGLSTQIETMRFWRDMQQISVFLTPFFLFRFALDFSENRLRWPLTALIIIPLTGILLIFTNPVHGLVREGYFLIEDAPFVQLRVDLTPLGALSLIASTAFLLVAVVMLLDYHRHVSLKVKKQIRLFVGAITLNVLLTIANLTLLRGLGYNVLTSTLYTPSAVILFYGFFRYDFFVVSPLSKEKLLTTLKDQILVLDESNRLVEFNEAAAEHFCDHHAVALEVGMPVWRFFPQPPCVPLGNNPHRNAYQEVAHPHGDEIRYFRIRYHSLQGNRHFQGTLIVIEDVTIDTQYEIQLKHRADRDPLTSLLNRTTFQQHYEQLERHNRSLVLLDIDDFKAINDAHGHAVGDRTLILFAAAMQEAAGGNAILGRLGGEEFGIAYQDIPSEEAKARAETLNRLIRERDFEGVNVTVSIGLAHDPDGSKPFDRIRAEADKALYQAKDAGKDTVCSDLDHPQ